MVSDPGTTFDCAVVGGGLAGLAAAHGLARRGRSVLVLEAGELVGGRARTLWFDGQPADRGFQSLFTSYPEMRRFLADIGLRSRDFVAFERGPVVHDGSGWAQVGFSPRALSRFPAFDTGDVVRLGRLCAEVAMSSPDALLAEDGPEESIEELLRASGFSPTAIDGFFRPLFGVITLDRSLSSDPGYFRFLMHMLVRGRAVIPVDGHGMIAEWATASVRQHGGEVRTGAAVAGIRVPEGGHGRAIGVLLDDGTEIDARFVVLATEAPAARALLAPHDAASAGRIPTQAAGVATLVYLLDAPFHSGRSIILNGSPDVGEPRIDLVCQQSNLTRPGGGASHVLLATHVTTGGDPDPPRDALEAEMARLAVRWSPGYDWARHSRLAEVVIEPFAQFRVPPGVRRELPGPRTSLENVILAGDLTLHPSFEGAVGSGRRAADIVSALIA